MVIFLKAVPSIQISPNYVVVILFWISKLTLCTSFLVWLSLILLNQMHGFPNCENIVISLRYISQHVLGCIRKVRFIGTAPGLVRWPLIALCSRSFKSVDQQTTMPPRSCKCDLSYGFLAFLMSDGCSMLGLSYYIYSPGFKCTFKASQ